VKWVFLLCNWWAMTNDALQIDVYFILRFISIRKKVGLWKDSRKMDILSLFCWKLRPFFNMSGNTHINSSEMINQKKGFNVLSESLLTHTLAAWRYSNCSGRQIQKAMGAINSTAENSSKLIVTMFPMPNISFSKVLWSH
jgi:hypothetical protein